MSNQAVAKRLNKNVKTVVILLIKKRMKKKRRKEFQNDEELPNPNGSQIWWTDIEEYSEDKPALRVDLDSLEVRRIQAVEWAKQKRIMYCVL